METGALHFAVNVVHHVVVHVDNVATGHHDIVLKFVVEEHTGNIDFHAERLAVARAGENYDIGAPGLIDTTGCGAAGNGEHFGDFRVEGLQRITPGTAHPAKNRNLIATILQQRDVHLRLLDESTVA